MHRTNIYLSDEQKTRLKAETDRTGLSASEITRRALDYWLDMKEDPLEQVAEQFRDGERKGVGSVDALGEIFEMVRMVDDRLADGTA